MGLYKLIEEELKQQGYNVFTIEDKTIKFDPYYKTGLLLNFFRRIRCFIIKPFNSYWDSHILTNSDLSKHYDIFFCIEGYSLSKYLLDHLKKFNPQIKSILYIWDSSSYYNYFRHKPYFNSIFTFDRIDALKFDVHFLPLFWSNNKLNDYKNTYTISSIGTVHSDRPILYKKIITQLELAGIKNHFIKLIVKKGQPSVRQRLTHLLECMFMRYFETQIENYKLSYTEYFPVYCIDKYISFEEYDTIMNESEIIFDTDRPNQYGLSLRFIWALSKNKKIITTNIDVMNYDFFDKNQIFVLNRNNPIISVDFIENQINDFDSRSKIIHLRLDNWVKSIFEL